MNLKNETAWKDWEAKNQGPYGKACVDVARRVMELIDDGREIDSHALIYQADKDIKAGGISGFMAGCVAQMVTVCHVRGDEFRRQWNLDNQIHDEGERANESGDVLNPAIITLITRPTEIE